MNLIHELLNILERKENKKTLDLKKDWFEFGRTKASNVGNPMYSPKMSAHAVRFDDLKCSIITGLVEGTGTEHTLPMWSTVNQNNCSVQTIVDSIFSQDAGATEGLVRGNFRVTGDTVLEGNLLVLGQQTIVESTIVQIADNIFRINSGGSPIDAGIEVIVPAGTKQFFFRDSDQYWTLDGESLDLHNIRIHNAIEMDGETLVNVVNEAEGLASHDDDKSIATVAAIIDWSDQMDLDVSADTGTPLDILLNSETLQIRGGSNITTDADGIEKIRIDLDDDIVVNSVTTNNLILTGLPAEYGVTSIVNDINDTVDPNLTLLTVKGIVNHIDAERDFVSNVVLNGTDLEFTGVNNAFSGVVDLSSLTNAADAYVVGVQLVGTSLQFNGQNGAYSGSVNLSSLNHIDYVSDIALVGTSLEVQGVGNAFQGPVDLSSIADVPVALTGAGGITISGTYPSFTIDGSGVGGSGVQLTDIVAGAKMLVSINGVAGTATISHQTTTTTPTTSTQTLAHSGTFDAIVDITHDAYGHITGYDTRKFTLPASGSSTDGVISNVAFNSSTSELTFTGSTGAFNGTIDLSALADGITYNATDGIQLVNPTTFGLVDVTRTNSSSTATPAHTGTFTVIDDITTNSKGQVTNVNVKTVTLPASGTGADGVITDVRLNDTDLVFTGSNGGFNGTVDLSSLQDGNATYALGLVASGSNDTVVKLTGANGGADSQFTLAGGAGITVTENTSTNTVVIASTVTNTNDIDYVSNVSLNGASLDFTGIGNAFSGSVDLSSLSVAETLTSLAINANTLTYTDENGNNTDIDLSLYLDDTNLARLVSGTLNATTGIATFTRDDASTFTVDLSSLIDVDTKYDLASRQNGTAVDISLVGSDSTSDTVTIKAGNNITLTDDGNNIFTIDAAGGSSYTFGTYLTETAGTVNHDATTRSDSASSQAATHGGTIRVVDGVTTNATGHVTAINLNTITLPEAGAGNVACSAGMIYNGSQVLSGTLTVLGAGSGFVLGFEQNAAATRHWNISWTIEYAMTGITGVKSFNTALRVTPAGGAAGTPIDWEDSGYMASEYKTTRTYTYQIANLGQGDRVEVLVSGSTDVRVTKAALTVTAVDCEAFGAGEVVLIENR